MRGIFKLSTFSATLIAAAITLTNGMTPSYAETGAVRFNVGSAGFIVGVGGGSGALRFKGRTYPLSVSGARIGTIGASSTQVTGVARNMHQPSDIVGTYSAVGASVAVVGGGGTARLQNEKGVVLDVRAVKVGLEANLNLGGVTISMR